MSTLSKYIFEREARDKFFVIFECAVRRVRDVMRDMIKILALRARTPRTLRMSSRVGKGDVLLGKVRVR